MNETPRRRIVVTKNFPIESHHPEHPTDLDVTSQVGYGWIQSGPSLPFYRCVCGKEQLQFLDTSPEHVIQCRECGRCFYFSFDVKVWEVEGAGIDNDFLKLKGDENA